MIKPGARIASMGYPDIIAHKKTVESLLGAKLYSLKYREDSAEIAKWVPDGKVIAIDASRNMIELAKQSFPASQYPNLEFHLVSADEFQNVGLFDKIFCFHCLNWVRKSKAALQQMCNLLRAGGELLILTYLKEGFSYRFLEDALKAYPEFQKNSSSHTMLSAEEHLQILRVNEMRIKEFLIRETTSFYQNKAEWRNYLKGWFGNYVKLPIEFHEDFLDQAVQNSLSYSISSDPDTILLQGTSLVIRAEKKEDNAQSTIPAIHK